jgi:hypothetical protein
MNCRAKPAVLKIPLPTEQRIRERAYSLWQADGCPEGRSDEYWYRAQEMDPLALRLTGRAFSTFQKSPMAILFLGGIASILFLYLLLAFSLHTEVVLSFFLILLVIIVGVLPSVQAQRLSYLDPEKHALLVNEYRKTITQAVTALLLVIGFFLTVRQITAAYEKDVGERFAKSIEAMGSASPDTRVGGVYSLGRVLQDSPSDARPIYEILAALVRQRADKVVATENTERAPTADVLAALWIIGRAKRNSDERQDIELDFRNTNLKRARLANLNFSKAKFIGVQFEDANLSKTELREADVSFASFNDAILRNADLRNANVLGATFIAADLTGADLTGVRNANADQLRKAILKGTLLPNELEAELKHVNR